MTVVEMLADRVRETTPASLTPEAIKWAKVSVLDTLGVAMAGAAEPSVRILDRVTTGGASQGPCLLMGTNRHASPLDAALLNGAAAHALDFDASNPVFAGHATMHLLAGAFAVAEMLDVDGPTFLAAYVAGFEAQSRIARGCQPEHSDKGWFASSTLGVFGVAAATGLLMGLSDTRLATAFAIASGLSAGLLAHSGTMTKPLSAGQSARNGLLAVLLAREGFTGAPDAFEHRYGVLNVFGFPDRFDARAQLADWGAPFEIGVTATGIKQYPCCGTFHAAIDLASALEAAHDIDPDRIEAVEVALITDRLHHVDRPDPQSAIDAKFSASYCIARTLLHGRPKISDFEGDAYREDAPRRLMGRIALSVHPRMRANLPRTEQGGASVVIVLRDGRRLVAEAEAPAGRAAGHPLPEPLLYAKFLDCVGRVISPSAGERLLAMLVDLDRAKNLRAVSVAMRPEK